MKLIKEDKYLLIVFLLMAIAIFVNTYFNSDGYLSSDSYRYLELAQNILKRNNTRLNFFIKRKYLSSEILTAITQAKNYFTTAILIMFVSVLPLLPAASMRAK